jgi:hypothetical protein
MFIENLRDPERFFERTRMSIISFDFLLSKLEHHPTKETTSWIKPVSPTEQLTVTLR